MRGARRLPGRWPAAALALAACTQSHGTTAPPLEAGAGDAAALGCQSAWTSCRGNVVQVCASDGTWHDGQTCAGASPDCVLGACGCSGMTCGGTCVHVDQDPANCGACGRSCLGAPCSQATCAPVLLASGQDQPGALVVSGGMVYFLNEDSAPAGAVMRVPSDGGASVAVASAVDQPVGLAVGSGYVYWDSAASRSSARRWTAERPTSSRSVSCDPERWRWTRER